MADDTDGETVVREAFPAIARIEDDDLRAGVVEAWTTTLAETGWDLAEVPWFPPLQAEWGLPDERTVTHVRDVVAASEALAGAMVERGAALSTDLVLAGALVHDISKLYEFGPPEGVETTVHELLGHPNYGIVPAARAGLPPEVLHVILAHSRRTAVEPETLEAQVVTGADRVAAASIRARATESR
ncbi:MAG: HD domain-containing protein [Haloferacaceae archaeon]|jgi:hypothetical protein